MTELNLSQVSKKFLIDQTDKRTKLRRVLAAKWLGVKTEEPESRYRQALHDVSLSLKPGQSFAIIGRNGAGKSTLLKIVAGTLQSDTGTVDIHGHVGGLIELGAGLDGEKSGRQNATERARLLGISETDCEAFVADIELFAELGDQFDDPISTYSSGMKARLGFAISVSLPFDIMICDEALAVGDARFATKCLAKINELKADRIFLFVSHSMNMVQRFCEEAMVLDAGRVCYSGPSTEAVAYFQNEILQLETAPPPDRDAKPADGRTKKAPSFLEPIVEGTSQLKDWSARATVTDSLRIEWRFELAEPIDDRRFRLGFPVFSAEGTMMFSCTLEDLSEHKRSATTFSGSLEVPHHGLQPGNYYLMVALFEGIAPVLRQILQVARIDASGQPFFGQYDPQHFWSNE